MILGKILFHGESEVNQLQKIFGLLGTPKDNIWKNSSSFSHKLVFT
jgi:hypothetical protein